MDARERIKEISDLLSQNRVVEARQKMAELAGADSGLTAPVDRGNACFGLASLQAMLGDIDAAVSSLLKASSAFEEANDHRHVAEVTRKTAEVLSGARRNEAAEPFAEKYLILAEALKDPAMYLDAALNLWSLRNVLGKKVEATRLMEEAQRVEWLKSAPNLLQEFLFLTRGVDPRSRAFAEDVARSGNERLQGQIYLEKGAECAESMNFGKAAQWYEMARDTACRLFDMQLYFYAIAGLLVAYNLDGRKLKCLETLMKGATTLRGILGEEVVGSFVFFYQSLRTMWGEEVFAQVLDQFRRETGLSATPRDNSPHGN